MQFVLSLLIIINGFTFNTQRTSAGEEQKLNEETDLGNFHFGPNQRFDTCERVLSIIKGLVVEILDKEYWKSSKD